MIKATSLTLADISDLRAYERERDEFRRQVIAVKKKRRISIGPILTCTFENRLTMRFQVQEMARAEKMSTDEQIQHELSVYNRLIPGPGELSATLFLELTDEASLRKWLPALVGIESSLVFRITSSDPEKKRNVGQAILSTPEQDHQAQLTRAEATAAVHYIRFLLSPDQVAAFAGGTVSLAVEHPGYPEGAAGTVLGDATRAELLADLEGR